MNPMHTLHDVWPSAAAEKALLVLLPGAYGKPADFRSEGFVDAVRNRRIAADIVMADAHVGYFSDRSVIRRLRDDVVLPAQRKGYRDIWLVGISLGGLAALGYAVRHGDDIRGVVAIAPYPGSREVLNEIESAGGPARWHAPPAAPADDLEREVWAWLGGPASRTQAPPPVFVGYGGEDRFVDGQAMLAGMLPVDHVHVVDGGHDWAPWRKIWESWLDRGLVRCGLAEDGDH